MYSLLKLYCLFFVGKKSVLDIMDNSVFSLRSILSKGKGVLSEILAKHIVLNKFPPRLLSFSEDFNEGGEDNLTMNEIAPNQNTPQDDKDLLKDETFSEFYCEYI